MARLGRGRPARAYLITNRPRIAAATVALSTGSETNSAQPLSRTKTAQLGIANDNEAGQALAWSKRTQASAATEDSTAQPLATGKTVSLTGAQATETALPLTAVKSLSADIAEEVGAAQDLGRPIGQLVDDFDDNVIDTELWAHNFGTVTEAGGRARVACDSGFNAYSSSRSWTLANSKVHVRVYPAIGATAAAQVLVMSGIVGTDIGFEINTDIGVLAMFSRVGWGDPDAVYIVFNATDHAWLRLRENAGTVYWETSPDGSTWTVGRSDTSPDWLAWTILEYQLITHRAAGTDDFTEFDNVNIPVGQLVTLGTADEDDAAQGITARKTIALTPAVESGAAQTTEAAKSTAASPAGETDAATGLGLQKQAATTAAAEIGAARAVGTIKTTSLAPAVESGAGFSLSTVKAASVTPAAQTDTAQALTGTRTYPLGTATETGTAQAPATTKTRSLTAAGETTESQTLSLAGGITTVVETDNAQPVGSSKALHLLAAVATDTARPVGQHKVVILGTAVEEGEACFLARAAGLATAVTHEFAQPLAAGKRHALTPAAEAGTAIPVGHGPGALLPAVVIEQPRQLGRAKTLALTAAVETGAARPLRGDDLDHHVGEARLGWAASLSTGRWTTSPGGRWEVSDPWI
ncbi:hypothetical protein [Streptomyces sp. SAJ15]|uniref:hypothetical protein n=1 Tax=Streptomyces sp. SAJ15 TaxID=2011095 RepID=UPI0011857639|nr:hypothetical protein [Streptomyces sp. SAJ15]TVL89757.1 hypothetical protein CD790_25510 [Streptomyces sp. SAJ15]